MSDFDKTAIPSSLAQRPQWVCWSEETRNGKKTKVPEQPDGSGRAKSNDMATWGTFQEACETAAQRGWGIGYMFSDAGPYAGIDLDGCFDGPDSPADWLPGLDPFVDETYIERSPSGDGLHIIVAEEEVPDWWTNQKDGEGDDEQGVEMYDSSRFFTFTGDILDISADTVSAVAETTDWLREAWEVFNDEPAEQRDTSTSGNSGSDLDGPDLDIHDVIQKSAYPMEERVGHPFHGSETGANFKVDENRETFRCWRHSCTGNAGHLLGMEVGVIDCGEWVPSGLDSDIWSEIFDRARERGYDIPEPLPQPTAEPMQTEADGGAAAASVGGAGPEYQNLRERVMSDVLVPVDPKKYGVDPDDVNQIDHDTAINRFANILCEEYDFIRPREDTRGWRDTLYVYDPDAGIYEPRGEAFIQMESERLLSNFATNQRVNEVVGKIERRSRVNVRELRDDCARLVVGNGILNLTTGELDDYTPDEFHRTRIDIEYDPDAEVDAIDDFLHDVVEDDNVPTLYRFIAHSLYREYPGEKAAMLLGEGQNGKSVFLSLVEEFLGRYNVANQSLQDLNEERWAANNLVGKLANIHPDMSDQTVQTMQMFKKLTGRDTISADVKYEKPVKFENHATLLFACNRMPVMQDDTRGNWRRWILINFPNTFERGDDDYVPKSELMNRIACEEELQGLLNRCVEEISEWAQGRSWFPDAPHWRESRKQIRRAAEPVYDFAEVCLRESTDEDDYISKDDAMACYRAYAAAEGLPVMTKEEFGRKLLNETDVDISKAQRRVNGTRKHVYDGVAFTSRAEELLNAEEEREAEQTQIEGGPKGRRERVLKWIRHTEMDPVDYSKLLANAQKAGMSKDQLEKAIRQLKEKGEITEPEDEHYRSTI